MEALDVTNRIGPPFDVVTRLKDSWESGHLICVVPWLVEYLKMTKRDTITRSTVSHLKTLQMLRKVRVSPIGEATEHKHANKEDIQVNNSDVEQSEHTSSSNNGNKRDDQQWNDTTQFLSIQIEQLFEILDEKISTPEKTKTKKTKTKEEQKGNGSGERHASTSSKTTTNTIGSSNGGADEENLITERLMVACCDRYSDVLQAFIVEPSSFNRSSSWVVFGATPHGTPQSTPHSTPQSMPQSTPQGNLFAGSLPGTPTSGYHRRNSSSLGGRRTSRKIRPVPVTRTSDDSTVRLSTSNLLSGLMGSSAFGTTTTTTTTTKMKTAPSTLTRSVSATSTLSNNNSTRLNTSAFASYAMPITTVGFSSPMPSSSPSLSTSSLSTSPFSTTSTSTSRASSTASSPSLEFVSSSATVTPEDEKNKKEKNMHQYVHIDHKRRLRQELSVMFFNRNPQQRDLCNFALKALVTNAKDHAIRTIAVPESNAFASRYQRRSNDEKSRRKMQYRLREAREKTTVACIQLAKHYCVQFLPPLILTVASADMVTLVIGSNGECIKAK